MDNFSTGLLASARACVKTGLAVYLARVKQQNLKYNYINDSSFLAGLVVRVAAL